MKYFEDGDLTVGIQVATKLPPLEDLIGDWHIVWGHIDSNERDTDYDEPNALNVMSFKIHRLEPSDKRRKPGPEDDNVQLDFNFLKWGLTYQGRYGDQAPVSNLRLVANTTPQWVDADDDAVILPAQVHDDQDVPFLSVATSAIDKRQAGSAPHALYQNMEFVAKKTDKTGRCPLELTKNERLRLGYKMDDDGVFEVTSGGRMDVEQLLMIPRRPGELNWQISDKCTKLMKELGRLTDLRKRVREQIGMLKQRMYEDLNEAGISPPSSPPARPRPSTSAGRGGASASVSASASRPTTSAVKRTSSGQAKAGSVRKVSRRGGRGGARSRGGTTRRKKIVSIRPQAAAPPQVNGHVSISDNSESESGVDDSDGSNNSGSDRDASGIDDSEDGVPANGTGFDTAAGSSGIMADSAAGQGLTGDDLRDPMKRCDLCDTWVTRRNWGVHVNTIKHQNNVKDGVTTRMAAGTPGSASKKRQNPGDGEVASPPSKRRGVGTPEGRLKRPSSFALKRDGGGGRDATTPRSA